MAALLAAIATHLADLGWAGMVGLLPLSPAFWIAMAVVYFAVPVTDWLIFRRVWGLPLRGLPLLVRKRIANELLLSYSGEVDFYLWARRNIGLAGAPFGTIKDVNIMSAVAGQAVTVVVLLAALPTLSSAGIGALGWQLWASLAVLLGAPLLLFVVRKRLFTLDGPELRWIAAAHVARLLVSTAALGLVWHFAMPALHLSVWLALAAIRLVVARLPLVPGKELMFAAVVPLLLGTSHPVTDLIATITALVTAIHVILGLLLSAGALAGRRGGA